MPDDGRPDFAALTRRAQQLRAGLLDAQRELTETQVSGHGGGGLVTALLTGDGRLVDLSIDSSVIDPDDPGTLTGLILAAVHDAHRTAEELRSERIDGAAQQMSAVLAGVRENLARTSPLRAAPPARPAYAGGES